MKRWKKATALAAVAVSMLSGSLNVSAAGIRDVFDGEYYADSYADLKEAFGYDTEALFLHYMTYGLSEGRSGSKVFDAAEYRSAYPDLESAFGDDWDAYVNHYCEYGMAEGRNAGVYGEIDFSSDDGSDADVGNDTAEKAEESADVGNDTTEKAEVYLHKGESVDFVYTMEGVEKPLHAKVTFADLTTEYVKWGSYTKIGEDTIVGAARYFTYTYTLEVELDPSIDWRQHPFAWNPDYDYNREVISKVTDVPSDDRSVFLYLDIGRYTFIDGFYSVGWEAFDDDSASQTIYIAVTGPVDIMNAAGDERYDSFAQYLYPEYCIGDGPCIKLLSE